MAVESICCDLALRPILWQYQARALMLLFRLFFVSSPGLHCREGEEHVYVLLCVGKGIQGICWVPVAYGEVHLTTAACKGTKEQKGTLAKPSVNKEMFKTLLDAFLYKRF